MCKDIQMSAELSSLLHISSCECSLSSAPFVVDLLLVKLLLWLHCSVAAGGFEFVTIF